MKELRRNLRVMGALLLALFLFAGAWLGYTVYTQGDSWASSAYNPRLQRSRAQRGRISDRDGTLLASTSDAGERVYLEDEQARRALSQTVGDSMGMSGAGVENFFSATLLDLSTSLWERIEELSSGAQHTGASVQITVDAALQSEIARAFPAGYRGAVCVTNYRTGEILAMVSMPNYDPYALASGREGTLDSAYLNRCLQGLYTPGSVFKIVTLACALDYDPFVTQRSFTCSGTWSYDGGSVVCMSGKTAHGVMQPDSAFAKSCNVTFGKLAYQLGMERLGATAELFGFNENFKFGDFVLYNSSFPHDSSNPNELVWGSIGQGRVLVTPLHMCMISGAVANGGSMMQPYLVQKIETASGQLVRRGAPSVYRQVMSEQSASTIVSYMYAAVQSGTASRSALSGYTVCGKTGSAETSDNKSVETNAWFTGFIAEPDKPYAVSVVIEQGGAGSKLASELAAGALASAVRLV